MHALVSAQSRRGLRVDQGEQGSALGSGQRGAADSRQHGPCDRQRVWRSAARATAFVRRNVFLFAWLTIAGRMEGQTNPSPETAPSAIEDNSFLIEEAYNQGRGIVQHISTFT